jgi:hypothetical protein
MEQDVNGKPQITTEEPERKGSRRDPEERPVSNSGEAKEKNLDKTLADSFPTSDPPSSIPDPSADAAQREEIKQQHIEEQLADLPVGTWAALSVEDREVLGTGPSRDAAVETARKKGHNILNLVRVEAKSPLGLAS